MDISLAVATNDSEQAAVQHLNDCGVHSFFKLILGYNSGYGYKPNPGMCLAFCSKLKIPSNQVLMVGDSVHDMEAGNSAGMITIGVLTGLADKDTLAPLADVILPDISFLPEWIAVNYP
jgi:phosphoglycolate phosphatase